MNKLEKTLSIGILALEGCQYPNQYQPSIQPNPDNGYIIGGRIFEWDLENGQYRIVWDGKKRERKKR